MKRISHCRTVLLAGFLGSIALLLVPAAMLRGAGQTVNDANIRVAVEWKGMHPAGQILVSDGTLEEMRVVRGQGEIQGSDRYSGQPGGSLRLELQIKGTAVRYGKGGTIVRVADKEHPFSFFLRDVNKDSPIYIPAYAVIVTTADDQRTYDEIERAVHARATQTKLQQIESEPEESFADAAANTRELQVPTWLGLGRDMRIFEVDERLESIQPRDHGYKVTLPEGGEEPVRYSLQMGRGWGVVDKITRRLDRGVLPILEGTLVDGDINYQLTAFVTLESAQLTAQNVRGTHYLVADGHGLGHMFTKEQQAQYDSLLPGEMNRAEETVLCVRMVAVNTASVSRYAFFRNTTPNLGSAAWGGKAPWSFDGTKGFGVYKSGRVFSVSKLNGKPLAAEEVAIELRPGEAATFEIDLPHRPIPGRYASSNGTKS